ncbi:MAG: site-specific integrase [Gaiellales bacterium]
MIVKRGRGYGVSVYDPALKRKRWVGTFASKVEARDAEREASRRRSVGGRMTCSEFATVWLKDYPRATGATRRSYRYALKAFSEEFGRVRLSEFDRLTAREWAQRAPQSNVRVVRAMFNDAINDGLHPGPNPLSNLRLEQSRGRKDLTALTLEQLDALADAALMVHGEFGPTFRAMILFSAYVGLRPGELFALERSNVRGDEVWIRQNLDGTGQLKAPKNGKERVVVLPPPARVALSAVPARLDLPWLFVTPRDRQFAKSSLYYYWNPVRAAVGRPGMGYYELRHFCATHLLELGLSPADVAVQLGHTDGGALVMSTYGHPSEDAARARVRRAFEPNVSAVQFDRGRVARSGSKSA